jgi:hypothetical protein
MPSRNRSRPRHLPGGHHAVATRDTRHAAPSPTPPLGPWMTWLARGTVGLAIAILFGLSPLSGGDLVRHVTLGQWIWAHRWVSTTDPFTYTAHGQTFIAHSWLAELTFYLIERATGTLGFIVLRFTLFGVALGFAIRTVQTMGATVPSMLLLAPVVLTILWGRLEFRPQLLTSSCLSIELWVLMRVYTRRRSARWLWILPPMLAVAINWHGGWVQLLVMLVVILGAQAINTRARGRDAVSHLPPHTLPLMGLAYAAALFVNPYGVSMITFPLHMEAAWIRAMGPEWQSPWTSAGWRFVGGGVYVSRLIFVMFVIDIALLGWTLITAVRRWRTADLMPIAVIGLWLALSSWHLRTVADTALITGPFVAAALGSWWQGARWPVWVGIGLLGGLTVIGLWGAWQWRDWRWTRGEPLCVEAAVERLGRTVRVLGDPRHEWLLYRLPDRVTVDLFWEYASGH